MSKIISPEQRNVLTTLLREFGFEAYLKLAEDEARFNVEQESLQGGSYPMYLAWDKIRREIRICRLIVTYLLQQTDE